MNFVESWASGLHDLLDALDKQNVPRAEDEAAINPSWESYRKRLAIKIEKSPEVLTSNWLRIASVPDTFRYYYPPGSINHALMEEACHESTMPAELYQRGFFSFASPEEIERDFGNVGKFEIQSEHKLFELMECGSQSPNIRGREAQNLITSLFRRAWENFCRSKGLYEHAFATQPGFHVGECQGRRFRCARGSRGAARASAGLRCCATVLAAKSGNTAYPQRRISGRSPLQAQSARAVR